MGNRPLMKAGISTEAPGHRNDGGWRRLSNKSKCRHEASYVLYSTSNAALRFAQEYHQRSRFGRTSVTALQVISDGRSTPPGGYRFQRPGRISQVAEMAGVKAMVLNDIVPGDTPVFHLLTATLARTAL